MKKVYSLPPLDHVVRDKAGGISQVIINIAPYLPEFGWEITPNIHEADIVAVHATDQIKADVLHCHGLYPTGEPDYDGSRVPLEINRRVVEAARRSPFMTVPSEWVADIFRRDMHIEPIVTHWGVDLDQWQHDGSHENYVLWNKNRTEGVCTPKWINELAKREPNIQFVSTFGEEGVKNLRLTGKVPHDLMRDIVKRAVVYLATTKETGDIGSREALAAGVPVLGFRHGALPDFVVHGVNGFLAEPHDIEGLRQGLHWCIANREKLHKNALKSAQSFSWKPAAALFADVYDRAYAVKQLPFKISVVIPCYNYDKYLAEAIESVLSQETEFDYEVIVVNDGSSDDSAAVAERYPVRLIEQENRGVAFARNRGIQEATGTVIACLDADDVMGEGFLQTCGKALEPDITMGIVYTGLKIMGSGHANPWPVEFDYKKQIERENRVPSLCMFRKEAWRRAGGFRQYMHPAEDADLWTRIATIGYHIKQVTTAPLHIYRTHAESALVKHRQEKKADPFRHPFIGYRHNGMAAGGRVWPIRNYDECLVSIILLPGDPARFRQTLDSIEGQSFSKWQLIYVGDPPERLLVNAVATDFHDAVKKSTGVLSIILHEGDHLHPQFIDKCLAKYRATGKYIYTDWHEHDGSAKKADQYLPESRIRHPVATLLATEELRSIADADSMYQEMAERGSCGEHLPETLIITDHVFVKEPTMCKCMEKQPVISSVSADAIKVALVSEMTGKTTIVGAATKTKYGKRRNGDKFYIFSDDFDAARFVKVNEVELPIQETVIPANL